MSQLVLLGLGSNIDPAEERVDEALANLSLVLDNAVASPLFRTPPLGYTDQPDFVNAVIIGLTELSAHELHKLVKGLEVSLGRVTRDQWREREIDIDIILYGDEIVTDLGLQIPHPRFRERRFVLQPAAIIAPQMRDPVTGKSIEELLAACTDESVLTTM